MHVKSGYNTVTLRYFVDCVSALLEGHVTEPSLIFDHFSRLLPLGFFVNITAYPKC